MAETKQRKKATSNNRPLRQSLKEYARGITGGLLFSFPLLYTMEVWWAGFTVSPQQLLLLVGVTYLLLLGYNRFAGMRPDVSWRSVMVDSVEELGIGLLLSFAVLLMLNRIEFGQMSTDEIMGKIIIEAMAVSIGVSVGTAQLGVNEGDTSADEETERRQKEQAERANKDSLYRSRLGSTVLALCGAILVGGNVAPTEEVLKIATDATSVNILMMALVSIVLCAIILFFSDIKGRASSHQNGFLYNLTFDTCISYLVGLAAAAFMLWFFGRFDGASFWVITSQVVTLGVLTSLGASAGRLLIKS
ncbi:TIGR02587 family membrane protein [Pontibacter litorisediminis]|uniref:TIGR02587 family membrane protein n=1 Tax=Pontibacter litorisediminis TaxID=1846260 RepID=UPI0023ECDA19|nr:TIGR02587 family membrane protein [Pontibacter litorisediminis]